jgi:hypothetical protein
MKKILLLTLVLLASNLFSQTLLTEYRFNGSFTNTSNTLPFAGTSGFANDRAGNSNSAYQVSNNFTNALFSGPTGSNTRSISLWYNTNSNAGYPVLFSYGGNSQYQKFGAYLGPDGHLIFWGYSYDYDFPQPYSTNVWRHLVVTFDGTNVIFYIDGVSIGSVSRPLINTPTGTDFSLLTTGFASKTVLFDDLQVFSGVLTPNQVQQLYFQNILEAITPSSQTFCSATNPTVSNLTTSYGTNIQWYANAFGGSPLTGATPLVNGNVYWCSQTVAGTESGRAPTTVSIQTSSSTVPTFTQIPPICSGTTLVLPSTSTNGVTGTWSPAVNNTATTTYTFSSSACSPTATMTVTVNPTPTAPTASTSVAYAQGQSATALSATGTNLLWYTQAVGGVGNPTAPVPNTAISGVFNYWVSQTNSNGCESSRTQITITVGNTNCLHFDGTNDLIQLSASSQKPTGNSSYTIEMWIAPSSGAFRGVINWGATSFNNLTALSVSGILVQASWGGGANLDAYYTFVTNQWNHIATTWDGTNRRIYINGVLSASDQPAAHNCTPNTQLTIGSNGGFTSFAGAMDEVRIFNYSKTATQIQAAMYCEIPNNTPGLTNYFRFNQGIASGNNTGLTIATNQINTSVDGGLAGFGLTGSTSNWINGSPMESQIIPTFGFATPLNICSGSTYVLPTTSLNGITGTWSPAFNNTVSATYTFTPSAGQCAATTAVTVQIIGSPMASTFNQVPAICVGETLAPLPTQSMQGNNGTWSPALNNTATTTYTFTPNPEVCASPATMTITVNTGTTPSFTQVAPVCSGTSFTLPTTSTNGISGTWAPAINTSATTTYTFTPAAGQCASPTTMTVVVNAPTAPVFTQIAPICSGTAFTLPTTSTNNISGSWAPAINTASTTTYTFTTTAGQCASPTTMTVVVNAPTTPTFNPVSAICSGETLTALPTVSTNGITGTWSPALNNTTTTTYTFVPTGGQCATNTTLTIVVNQPTVPSFNQVQPICAGETLAALPTNSINGFVGTWSPALNNMSTTTYTFTPSAGQCAVSTTMTITVYAPTTPLFTQIAPICVGDQIVGLYNISNNNIFGSWSPIANNQTTTTYTFTPDIFECATTTTMTVVVNSAPTAPTFTQVPAICSGNPITLPTISNEGVIGTWSPAANNLATTTYTFTPAAGQCATTTTMTVTVIPTPTTPTGNATQAFTSGATLADVIITPSSVTWYANLQDAANEVNALSPSTALNNGSSYFAVSTIAGCSSLPFEVVIQITAGLGDDKSSIGFAMYPNPSSSEVTIVGLSIGSSITLSDASGRIIQYLITRTEEEILNVTSCTEGIYFVQIQTALGDTATKKLIVKK